MSDFHEQLIQKKVNFVIFLTFSLDKEFLPKLLKNHQAIREDLGWSSMWFWAMGSRTGKLTELINNWIAVCVSDALWLNSLKSLKNNLILPRIESLCPLLSSSVGGGGGSGGGDQSLWFYRLVSFMKWRRETKQRKELFKNPVLPCEITTYSTHANPLIVLLRQSSLWITSATPAV